MTRRVWFRSPTGGDALAEEAAVQAHREEAAFAAGLRAAWARPNAALQRAMREAPPPASAPQAAEAGPVTSWRAAAGVLGVSDDTIARRRREHAPDARPWWPTAEACRAWWQGLGAAPVPAPRAPRVRRREPAPAGGTTLASLQKRR